MSDNNHLMLEYRVPYLVFDNEHAQLVNALPYIDERDTTK